MAEPFFGPRTKGILNQNSRFFFFYENEKSQNCQSILGCETCGCNIEFTIGGCNPSTGQCECLPGVVGLNCDRCPTNWVLVVNDTRTVEPEWKQNFDYDEGCFPCSSCVSDLMESADKLDKTLEPIMNEFDAANSTFFAYTRLNYIEEDVEKLRPEIELLNPLEGIHFQFSNKKLVKP